MNLRPSHTALLVFLGVVALLFAAHRDFLLVTPWQEDGDFAVNALQIDRARQLGEIHGNYSRFHFHHPGPAFFYVYAAGEYLLHDRLGLVPAPHNAHVLAGLILQAAFFSAALGIAAGWVRSRLFLPLALLLGGVHFSLADNAFTSIWPPHALLMPCLCFVVAGASTAAGRIWHLPVAVLAGCFLVHGHVAQALFVVPLFLLAYARFWRDARGPGDGVWQPFRSHRAPHLLAAACIGLFVLPLGLDLGAGADSNLADILRFTFAGKDESKSLLQSASYLLSFFTYYHRQELFLPEQGGGQPGFIWARAAWFPVWLALLAYVGFALFRRKSPEGDRPEHRFLLALALLLAAGFGLSLLWGVMQNGPMYEFNSHFNYALIYALLLLFAALVGPRLPERSGRLASAVLCGGGALALWQGTHLPISAHPDSLAWPAATREVLRSDPRPDATKYLVFDHDEWGDVAKTALALTRLGGDFRVDGSWSFMFGRERTFRPASPDYDLRNLSVWRFSRQALPGRKATLPDGLHVHFDPSPLDPAGTVIDCRQGGNLAAYVLFGISSPAPTGAWTSLSEAGLQFASPPAARDILLSVTAEPFVRRGRISAQPVELFVNGSKVATGSLDRPRTLTLRIPAEVWNREPVVTLVLSLPQAVSPRRLGHSRDPRTLGWLLRELKFELAPP